MPRLLKLGTPDRTKKYVIPGLRGRGLLLASLGVGTAIALVVLGLNFAGLRRMASPGPLASAHAPLDARCDDCHARNVAADLRCERCHDPAASDAWRVASHAAFNPAVSAFPAFSAGTPRAPKVKGVRCAECHEDHRGRGFELSRVDERHCAVCHENDTPSLGKHVDFAVVRAGKTPPRGMKITHERHVKEALARLLGKKKAEELTDAEKRAGLTGPMFQRTCETCHVSTADLRGFEPIDFDRHCAACHRKDGSVGATDPLPAADVVAPDRIAAAWAPAAAAKITARRDKLVKTELLHADPWVLFNLAKIRREVDPAAYLADRAMLVRRVQEFERAGASFALSAAGEERLAKREAELSAAIDAVRKRAAASGKSDAPALAATLAPYEALGAALSGDEGKRAADALSAAKKRAALGEKPDALSAADASARKTELLSVLDTLRRRAATANDVLLARRVDVLARAAAAYRPGKSGLDDLTRTLALLSSEKERVADERDYLRRARGGPSLAVSRVQDRARAEAGAALARSSLDSLAVVDGLPAAPLDEAAKASRLSTVDSLLVPCVKCHETGKASLAKLAIDLPVMPQAVFDHRPHVRIRECASCHAVGGKGVLVSKSARDVLVPGVASCRTCHHPSGARSGCETCHRFHPSGYPSREAPRDPSTMLASALAGGAR
jgi:hypothetical protein